MARLGREAWFQAGLDILATRGALHVTIDNLATTLQVTKGSFYHHFRNYETYKIALLAFFEQVRTQHVINQVEHAGTPAQKLRQLFRTAAQHASSAEAAIRAWAMQDKDVQKLQAQIDQQRIAYVASLCMQLGAEHTQAQLMAQLAYSILVGTQHIQPLLFPEEVDALFIEFCRIYAIE